MKTYAQVDAGGYVTAIANGRQHPGDGWIEYPDDGPRLGVYRIKMVAGQPQVTSESLTPAPNYDLQRVNSYPPLGDQMDMLWHAMDSGALPRVEPFYGSIKAVKNAHPKPR